MSVYIGGENTCPQSLDVGWYFHKSICIRSTTFYEAGKCAEIIEETSFLHELELGE